MSVNRELVSSSRSLDLAQTNVLTTIWVLKNVGGPNLTSTVSQVLLGVCFQRDLDLPFSTVDQRFRQVSETWFYD